MVKMAGKTSVLPFNGCWCLRPDEVDWV
ncbi:hypothetical protein EMIT0194MI4_20109 [Pseudomonas sp. IT-194MI4]